MPKPIDSYQTLNDDQLMILLEDCVKLGDMDDLAAVRQEVDWRKQNDIHVGKVWPYPIQVAGISFRVQKTSQLGESDIIRLEREVGNPHDAWAIKVLLVDGATSTHIGYVPARFSSQIKSDVLPSNGRIVWRSKDEDHPGLRIGV